MPTPSPAFTMFVGFLILAVGGLFCWNLHLHNLLRTARAREGEPLPVAPSPPEQTMMEQPPAARHETEPTPVVADPDSSWRQRLAHTDLQLQLVQQELAALSYSVSHDLRAPLRAIDGFSQALAEDYGHALDTTAQGYLQRVRANARHMTSLTEDLLSLSRLARAPMQREWVELGPIAESIVAGLRKADPERVATLEVQPGLRAFADRSLAETVLRNLLDNSWKFTARRAVARLSFRANTRAEADGTSEVVYEIRDNGAGFDMNYAGKLFGAFQRMHTQEEFAGNGIGLAAVQRIVRRHGGRVWATAAPDKGTAVFFTLAAGVVTGEPWDANLAHLAGAALPASPGSEPMPFANSTVL